VFGNSKKNNTKIVGAYKLPPQTNPFGSFYLI